MNRPARRETRIWAAGTLVVGLISLIAPTLLIDAVTGRVRPAKIVLRVLGARQLAQGLIVLLRPDELTLAGGSGVDALHGSSMLALALIMPEFRKPALISAALAGLSATFGGIIFSRPMS